jgi:hypothetical protein
MIWSLTPGVGETPGTARILVAMQAVLVAEGMVELESSLENANNLRAARPSRKNCGRTRA